MDTKQTNRVTMYKTVTAYLRGHNSVWSGMVPLANAVEQFNHQIEAIDFAAQKQETPTSGATDTKAAARDALEDVLFLTCEALAVLAHSNNNHDLLALADLSPSILRNLGDAELLNRATLVVAAANAHSADLVAMQVTQENLDELDLALRAFNLMKEKPRTATAERMAQTESLASLIRTANDLLRNQIDRLVNLFSRSNADFVAGYRGARVVVDRAATHSSTPTVVSPPPTPNP